MVSLASRLLYPLVPIGEEAVWPAEAVWTRRREKPVTALKIEIPFFSRPALKVALVLIELSVG